MNGLRNFVVNQLFEVSCDWSLVVKRAHKITAKTIAPMAIVKPH